MRAYVGLEKPDEKLKVLANFVLRVYVPQWFSIRRAPSCLEGSQHLFNGIRLSRYLPKKYRDEVDKTIQKNAFFAHL